MASFVSFYDYAEQLNKAKHDWSSHTFKIALTNSAPSRSNTVLADITQISTGGGYTSGAGGGYTLDTVTLTETTGLAKVTIADEVITATGGAIAAFQYIVLYNDTSTGDMLVGYWNYGSAVNLNDTETFTVDFDATNGVMQTQGAS